MLFIKRCSGELRPLHNHAKNRLWNREKRRVRSTFLRHLPIRGIITTDKGRYFSLIRNTCEQKKLKKFRF